MKKVASVSIGELASKYGIPTSEKIEIGKMNVDGRYQRALESPRAERMGAALDPARLQVFILSLRPDGSFIVIDGQHRYEACKHRGFNGPVDCHVFRGLSLQQEAALFDDLNRDRKAVGAWDQFKARLVAENSVELAIVKIARSKGLRPGGTVGKNVITAVRALYSVHSRGNLGPVLGVLVAWSDGGDPSYFEGLLLKSLSYFLEWYGDAVDVDRLVERLSTWSPARVVNKYKRLTDMADGLSRKLAAVSVYREIYNSGRSKGKLPPIQVVGGAEEAAAAE